MRQRNYEHLSPLDRAERELADAKSDVEHAECNLGELRTILAIKEEAYSILCEKALLSSQDAAEVLYGLERRA